MSGGECQAQFWECPQLWSRQKCGSSDVHRKIKCIYSDGAHLHGSLRPDEKKPL